MNLVFDIGGLSTKYILFDEQKKIVIKDHYHYQKLISNQEIEPIVTNIFLQLAKKYQIKNIAISTLGVVNSQTGSISGLGGIKDYDLINWKKIFQLITKIPVYLENDANSAALYELSVNKNLNNALLFIIGTGVGGAIIINNKLYKGSFNASGEFGGALEKLVDNNYYNVSSQASTYSIVTRYEKLSSVQKSGKEIFDQYEKDKNAKISIDEMVFALAKTIVNNVFAFDPEVVIIGGGISENTLFLQLLDKQIIILMEKSGMRKLFKIKACTKNNDANLYGALTLIS